MVILTRVCAWCGHVIREGEKGSDVSHGICATCYVKVFDTRKEAA